MMKKIALLLCLVLTISMVAGCASGATTTTQAASGSTTTGSTKVRTLQLGHLDPSQPDNAYQIFCEKFKEKIEKLSGGKIKVDIFGDAMLGGEIQLFEGMKLGNVDMAIMTNNYYGNFVKDNMVFDLPFLFTDYDTVHKVLDDEEVMAGIKKQLYDDWNVKFLAWGDSGFRYVVNNKRPIYTVADFQGIKIRLPENPVYVQTFKALGANPTTMAFSEAFTAVQQGTVDGLEITASAINTAGYYQICKYLSKTGHFVSPIAINMSKKTWESLTAEEQNWVQTAAIQARDEQRVTVISNEQKLLDKMAAAGIKINELTDKKEFQTVVAPVFDYIKTVIKNQSQLDIVKSKLGLK